MFDFKNHATINIIVATAADDVIGVERDGTCFIPWKCPEDMKFFKEMTLFHPVVMGRKTWESIGKPLELRDNYVVSSTMEDQDGITVLREFSEDSLRNIARKTGQVFVIGGAGLYNEALQFADVLYLNKINIKINESLYESVIRFPKVERGQWCPVKMAFRENVQYYKMIRRSLWKPK